MLYLVMRYDTFFFVLQSPAFKMDTIRFVKIPFLQHCILRIAKSDY